MPHHGPFNFNYQFESSVEARDADLGVWDRTFSRGWVDMKLMTALRDAPIPVASAEPAAVVGDMEPSHTAGYPSFEGQSQGLLSQAAQRETAYCWSCASDHMEWEANAAETLGVRDEATIGTGNAFQLLIAPEHIARRVAAIAFDHLNEVATGVPYRLQYRLMPEGLRSDASIWVEEQGRCWSDHDGKPAHARGILRVVSEAQMQEQRLLHLNDHDELTGLLNRIRLTEALAALVTRAERTRQPCAFLMVSVNNLAMINETFGFDVGDEVIAEAARQIQEQMRGGDTIGRYSSNKFGVILSDCGPGAMRIAAARFMKAVSAASFTTRACKLAATVSVGGVLIPDHARTMQEALSHSLQALDQSKGKRVDYFTCYEPVANHASIRRRKIMIADEIISALDDERMLLALQPIVCSITGKPRFYECLLRLKQPDGSSISAGDFIPVAEQLGLSRLIDMRTLRLSIDLLKRYPTINLSLNVSGHIANNHEWLVSLHKLTRGKKEILSRLIIEITETAAINDIDQTTAFVDTLKELGCRVAIDDFGAGYTSFKNLKHLDVDMVKIDGAFCTNLVNDPHDLIFIKTLRELANTFGIETVAEWVADQATADIIRDAGITYMQGFLFGKPILSTDFDHARLEAAN
jgi:diguanylate cyclase (GGDEF)-like protein